MKKRTLRPDEIALFCTQTAYILKAGIPLYDGMAVVYADMDESYLKQCFVDIDKLTSTGIPLASAMEQVGVFPNYVVNMMTIGEHTGKREEALNALALYYEREKALRERLFSAVFNPIVLFVMMSFVVILLVTKVLPMFIEIFNQLGGDVSVQAGAAINVGIGAGIAALALIALVIIVVLTVIFASKTQRGGVFFGRIVAGFSLTKKFSSKIAARDFSSAMYMLLSSGETTDNATNQACGLISNKYLKSKLVSVCEKLNQGMSFAEVIADVKIFPGLFISMLSVGFRTGSLDETMKKVSDMYEQEVSTSLNNITSVVEPVLVGILAVIIGSILIAVMLPLAGIMSAIG